MKKAVSAILCLILISSAVFNDKAIAQLQENPTGFIKTFPHYFFSSISGIGTGIGSSIQRIDVLSIVKGTVTLSTRNKRALTSSIESIFKGSTNIIPSRKTIKLSGVNYRGEIILKGVDNDKGYFFSFAIPQDYIDRAPTGNKRDFSVTFPSILKVSYKSSPIYLKIPNTNKITGARFKNKALANAKFDVVTRENKAIATGRFNLAFTKSKNGKSVDIPEAEGPLKINPKSIRVEVKNIPPGLKKLYFDAAYDTEILKFGLAEVIGNTQAYIGLFNHAIAIFGPGDKDIPSTVAFTLEIKPYFNTGKTTLILENPHDLTYESSTQTYISTPISGVTVSLDKNQITATENK